MQIPYVTLLVPWILIVILMSKILYSNASEVYAGLASVLAPSWWKLLSINLWVRAIADTVLSLNLGYGVIAFLSSLNKHTLDCFKYVSCINFLLAYKTAVVN